MAPSSLRTLTLLVTILFWAGLASAQETLTLEQAIAATLAGNPAVAASRAAVDEADARVSQAAAGWWPRVDLVESWQRGNAPVFAFSSLLAQRRFSEANFAIGALNHPDAIGNLQGVVTADQMVFDGARTTALRNAAVAQLGIARSGAAQTLSDLSVATVQTYGRVLAAGAAARAAQAAVVAAQADLERANARRDVGTATQADVLSVRVHLARMEERRIRSEKDETTARAELNRLMNVPLDRAYALQDPGPLADSGELSIDTIDPLEQEAIARRHELEQARLRESAARAARGAARADLWPQVHVQASFALDGATFADRRSSWLVGTHIRWNVFAGGGDRARLRGADAAIERAAAERERLEGEIRVEVRSAAAMLAAARAREEVGRAAVEQARESHRMLRDRYEAGLATMTDVLTAAMATLDAELQQATARLDRLVARSMLNRAVGRQP